VRLSRDSGMPGAGTAIGGPYRPVPVDSRLLRELGAQASGLPGLEHRWFATVSQRAALGALMIDAASAIVGDRQQSAEGSPGSARPRTPSKPTGTG
jgi:hypothetical protein